MHLLSYSDRSANNIRPRTPAAAVRTWTDSSSEDRAGNYNKNSDAIKQCKPQ